MHLAEQVLTAIGNFCLCSITVGFVIEIIGMVIQHRPYRMVIDNLLVLLVGGIPIAMPTVLSVTMATGSHRLSQQVCCTVYTLFRLLFRQLFGLCDPSLNFADFLKSLFIGSYH